MTATKSIPLFTRTAEKLWQQRSDISTELAHLESRVRTLKEDREEIDDLLASSFEQHGKYRTRQGTVIVRQTIEVAEATIVRSAYSYVKYRELAG